VLMSVNKAALLGTRHLPLWTVLPPNRRIWPRVGMVFHLRAIWPQLGFQRVQTQSCANQNCLAAFRMALSLWPRGGIGIRSDCRARASVRTRIMQNVCGLLTPE
jgi:hypothetical protein